MTARIEMHQSETTTVLQIVMHNQSTLSPDEDQSGRKRHNQREKAKSCTKKSNYVKINIPEVLGNVFIQDEVDT